METAMHCQFTSLAAAARNQARPRLSSTEDHEPHLPEGYRPIRDAIRAILMCEPEKESIAAHPNGTQVGEERQAW